MWILGGIILRKPITNEYDVLNEYVRVKLTNCNEYMLCDLDDWGKLKHLTWSKDKSGYARSVAPRVNGKTRNMFFHRKIIDCPDGFIRDHINKNKLDNRKQNIRITTVQVNIINRNAQRNNTSGYTGVFFDYKCNKWRSFIQLNHKRKYLGTFLFKDDAIKARISAEKIYYEPLFKAI